jgi:hypothetical protein
VPGRVWKYSRVRRPSQRKASAAATDSRFQLLRTCVRTGVSPHGAQVRRTTGCWESPLSSSKTSQARCRRAFVLPPATALGPTGEWRPRRVRRPGAPAAGATSSSAAGSARHGPGETEGRSGARSPRRSAARSTGRSQTRGPGARAGAPDRPAPAAEDSGAACGPAGRPPSDPRGPPAPSPDTIDTRSWASRPRPERPPPATRPDQTGAPPRTGAPPARPRPLSWPWLNMAS